jgi:hypothetical protein
MNKRLLMFLIIILAFGLFGCGTTAYLSPTPKAADPGVVDKWVVAQITQQAQQALATPTRLPQATPTPAENVWDLAATVAWAEANIALTQQAEYINAQNAEATLQAEIYRDGATGTAAANQVAAAATGTAIPAQTGTAWALTGTPMAWTQTAIKTSVFLTNVAIQSDMEHDRLENENLAKEIERKNVTMVLTAVVFAGALAIVIVLAIRAMKVRELDENDSTTGEAKSYLLEDRDENGKPVKVVIKPKHIRGSHLTVRAGTVSEAEGADGEHQQAVTRRAQAVEAIRNMPPNDRKQGVGVYGSNFTNSNGSTAIETVDSDQVGKVLDQAETDVLEG